MSDTNNGNGFPDISGIFDVNDNEIPRNLIERTEKGTEKRHTENSGVIFSEKPSKAEQLKKRQTVRRRGNAAKKRMLRRKRLIAAGVAFFALIVLVLGIKAAIVNSKKPTVELYTVTKGDVREIYTSPAVIVTASTKNSPISTYALIPENSYDIKKIAVNLPAIITTENGTSYEARVIQIEDENADSELTKSVKEALPDIEYSAASNIFIYVKANAPMNEADGSVVKAEIITAECIDTVFVPNECVISDKDGNFVWVVNKLTKELSKRYITASLSADGNTAVLGGLKKNERVVSAVISDPNEFVLTEGKKVKIAQPQNTEQESKEEPTT